MKPYAHTTRSHTEAEIKQAMQDGTVIEAMVYGKIVGFTPSRWPDGQYVDSITLESHDGRIQWTIPGITYIRPAPIED